MERTTDTIKELSDAGYLRRRFLEIFQEYKNDPAHEIEGYITDITTGQFEGILSDIRRKIFDPSRVLFTGCDLDAFYNLPVLDTVATIYSDICRMYNKVPSVLGFSVLTGIDSSILNSWSNNIIMSNGIYDSSSFMGFANNTGREAKAIKADIVKHIKENRENAITNKLLDLGQSVGMIAVANREYKWNIEQIREETQARALTLAELPKLMSTDSTNTAGIEAHGNP